jgi:hypothetical protein
LAISTGENNRSTSAGQGNRVKASLGELTPKIWNQPVENRSQPMKMHENG